MPRIHFTKQLEQLNDQMITMGCMIENTISMAIKALAEQDLPTLTKLLDDGRRRKEEVDGH